MSVFKKKSWILLLLILSGQLSCYPRPVSRSIMDAPIVRVRLLTSVKQVDLGFAEPPVLITEGGKTQIKLGTLPGQTVRVAWTGQRWTINTTPAGTGVAQFIPTSDGSISVNGSAYRGQIRLVPTGAEEFDVVNDLDVESYLQGVLAKELFPDWHPEAYRAQAVIARTYALYEVKTGPKDRHFDLHADERSQVYGGIAAETEKANQAVQSTRGVVVAWGTTGQEKIFKAYFSSCCGGVSASQGDAFKETTIPPLDAKYNGATCSISSRYNWGPVTVTKSDLTQRFRNWGIRNRHPIASLQSLSGLEVATTNAFGRPRRFVVTDMNGQQYMLSSEETRWAINTPGATPLKGVTVFSGFFRTIDMGSNIQIVDGHGFGHGVGACQWCMQARALAGENFEQIVLKAYPQSKVLLAY
jgi:stage II sporulation protein D